MNDPAIVWADEPTGDLDSENAQDIIDLLRRFNHERGLSFLIVTHDISPATIHVEKSMLSLPNTAYRALHRSIQSTTTVTPVAVNVRRSGTRASRRSGTAPMSISEMPASAGRLARRRA